MLDHVFITVSDIAATERFYDAIMTALGIVKGRSPRRSAWQFDRLGDADPPAARHRQEAGAVHNLARAVAWSPGVPSTSRIFRASSAIRYGLSINATPGSSRP
jgi:catechol 2,3-dioxygenase-like lactoylglutathione lyase family enzyme